MTYYAHSRRKKKGIPAQTYSGHVNGVIERAREHAGCIRKHAKLDGDQLVRITEIAAAYHDLGKLQKENQAVLSGEEERKSLPQRHEDAGTAFLLDDNHLSLSAAVVVRSHHEGLPDYINESNRGEAFFRNADIMRDVDKALPFYVSIHDSLIQTAITYEKENIRGDLSVFLRMLLSCVVDADHTDTAVHYKNYPAKVEPVLLRAEERLAALNNHVAGLKGENEDRDALRREMYAACRDADIDSIISSCDSPVGSGKTTAVMAHLLAQAEKRKLRRIFVVLPFTNIIRQSVDTYRKSLVLPGENPEDVVAELHHRADFQSADARHLTALWRAPIIVTTAVAFFETMASASPSALRRLHELPGSAVFVDESHAALPAKLLPLAWRWINIYASEWNCYWVLASGSLNRFWSIREIAEGVADTARVPEIVNDALRERLSRYERDRIIYKHDLQPRNAEELTKWIAGFDGPRLVIMNTVQSAAVLANQFMKSFGQGNVEHLSTALTPNDRDATLDRVQKRLKCQEDKDWTLVATSCVEAGVNLSFKNGFRELGALVSLLQAAGRVNREGKHSDSEMWVFCIAEGGMLQINPGMKESASVLQGYLSGGIEIDASLSTQSISDEIKLYSVSGKYKELVKQERSKRFSLVERDFQVIDTNTSIAVIDEEMADRVRYEKINWQELQKNSVQIANYRLKEFKAPMIMEGIYHWDLGYNKFLGYMAGILQMKSLLEY